MRNAPTAPVETSIVAKGTSIKGNMDFAGTLIVEGSLESEIQGVEMTIQKSGRIKGSIKVQTLNCHGEIDGNISADSVVIHSSAVISGEVKVATLEVEPGATINGSIIMQAPKTASIKQLSDKLNDKLGEQLNAGK